MSPEVPPELAERAGRVRALVLDVDGVLTDGRMVYDEFGDELKCFDVQDGTGIVFWRRAGLKTAIITARKTKLVQRHAKDLMVDFVAQQALLKLLAYERFLRRFKLSHDQVCAMGDDLLDLPVLRRVGLAVAVPNAVEEVKGASHYVTAKSGGRGAVREVIEMVLKIQGKWDDILKPYFK